MKTLLTVIMFPLYASGIVLGFLAKPIFMGAIVGYFALELQAYHKILKDYEQESPPTE